LIPLTRMISSPWSDWLVPLVLAGLSVDVVVDGIGDVDLERDRELERLMDERR